MVGKIAWVLVIIGAINWGLIGFFGSNWNLVAKIFGSGTNIIYDLVGLSALYLIFAGKKMKM